MSALPASPPTFATSAAAAAAAISYGQAVALVVFARAPVVGQVKTRLFSVSGSAAGAGGPVLSAGEAADLYRAFVADVCARGERSGIGRRRLYVAPSPADVSGPEADRFLKAVADRHGFEVRTQVGGDLGARMDHAIQAELAQGAAGVILVGSDSPTVPTAYFQGAATALLPGPPGAGADVVLGPATDGGYWLVGARRPCPDLFVPGIGWGTGTVLVATLERLAAARAEGRGVCLMPFFYDVDTPEDLRLLVAHLRLGGEAAAEAPETLRALLHIGLMD